MRVEYTRLIQKRSTIPGEIPTAPANPGDLNTWVATDIAEGELFYNVPDEKLYTRSGSNIVEITGGTGGGSGAQGPVGPQGATVGATGAQGPQGNQGPTGQIGPQGFQGSGVTGAAGPQGLAGPQGFGLDGANSGRWIGVLAATGASVGVPGIGEFVPYLSGTNMIDLDNIKINAYGDNGGDYSNWQTELINKWSSVGSNNFFFQLSKVDDTSIFGIYNVIGATFNAAFGADLNIQAISANGVYTAGEYSISWIYGIAGASGGVGSQGPQGNTGAAGAQGSVGPQGLQGFQGLQGPTGLGGTIAAYGSFYDVTNQSNAGATAANTILLGNTAEASGVSIVGGSQIKVDQGGTYNLQFSAQFVHTNNAEADVEIWLVKNGTNVADSNTKITLEKAQGGSDTYYVPAWNWVLTLAANDYLQIKWHSADTTVELVTFSAGTSPTRPVVPSIIATLTQVTYTQVGPQGHQGIAGAQGNVGPQGAAGTAGAQGQAGPQGLQGVAGAQGNVGPQGIAGSQGQTGPQGLQGVAGATGNFGGGLIGPNFYYVPVVADNATTNGDNLRTAYAYAKTATPNGNALAIGNRFTIFMPPGVYNMTTTLTVDTNFIDIVGMGGDHAAAVITSTTVSPVTITSAATDYQLRSFTIENNANSNSIYCIVIPSGNRYQEYWYNLKFQYGSSAGVNTRIHTHSRNFGGRYERIYLETRKNGTGTSYPSQFVVMNLFGAEHRTAGDTATGTLDGTFTDIAFAPNINNDVSSFQYVSYELFNFATLSGTFTNIHLAMHVAGSAGPNLGRIRFADRITTAAGYFNNISYTDQGTSGMEFYGFNGGTLSGTFQNFSFLSRSNLGIFGDATSSSGETLSGTFSNMTLRCINNGSGRGIFNSQTLSGNFTNIHIITNRAHAFGGEKDSVQAVLSGTFINCGVVITGNSITESVFGGARNKAAAQRGICSGYFKNCYHRVTGSGATITTFAGSTNGEASGYFEDCEISCESTITEFRPFGGITAQGFSGTLANVRLQATWSGIVTGTAQIYRSDFLASGATSSAITNIQNGAKLAYCRAISTGATASMQGATASYYLCAFNVAPTNPNTITTPNNVIDANI